jgi:glutamine amidotransferase
MFSDGEELIVHCSNNLHWVTRRAPFGQATLKDVEISVDFGKDTSPNDVVSVIATEPLTIDEHWHQLQPQELLVFREGEIRAHYQALRKLL